MRPRDDQAARRRLRHPIRSAFLLLLLAVVIFTARPALHLALSARRDDPGGAAARPALPAGTVDDASGLNATAVAEVFDVPADPAAAEAQLAALLRRAGQQGLSVSITGARHSMGGHTIAAGGLVVNMLPFRRLGLDEAANVLRAGAGARWSEVLPFLAARGRSVAVMQANNDFSVGGSLSVNCHGWQPNSGPIASTVRSFRLMLADGSIRRCSRQENAELFRGVLGGYGLFGIILEADLDVVADTLYCVETLEVPAHSYAALFGQKVRGAAPGSVGMAYGRVSVAPGSFGREAILTLFHPEPEDPGGNGNGGASPPRPQAGPGLVDDLKRTVFRGSAGSAYGKSLRWRAEKALGETFGGGTYRRNAILDAPAAFYGNRTAGRTDILQELFVPPARLAEFLERLRTIIASHAADADGPDLLNVTVRDVRGDPDSLLAYARGEDTFGLVLLFEQATSPAAAARGAILARELVEAALVVDGTYYLPYRLDATPEQFNRAYPRAAEFFALKRHYDPQELFQNAFYRAYGRTPRDQDGR